MNFSSVLKPVKSIPMKKISTLMLAVFAIILISSCRKEGTDVTKTINVTMYAGDTYSYSVNHAGDGDDVMEITAQASHASVSEVKSSNSNGDVIFQYTPASGYTGSDEVHVANVEEHKGNPPPPSGGNCGNNPPPPPQNSNCGGHHHQGTTTYIFKITVSASNK